MAIYCGACKGWHIDGQQVEKCHGLPARSPIAGVALDGHTRWTTKEAAETAHAALVAHWDALADAEAA
ncbi:hypothetical protein [Verrucosispora sp. NA02020]|uniref:hypothetical protein n=1 Tax=Verrucosispora sp. NA02020 TaxID=2742132 RepID=UPI001592270B|nr:hypothetical protein [Verrucosispora sp. NA02020]QKW15471.1 hypothetical protein HUT12_23670 [Verrucosispora sp. NA02020]